MTREEYLNKLREHPISKEDLSAVVVMSKYIQYLEKQVVELELKLLEVQDACYSLTEKGGVL
jgi:hypothetical protein